MLILLMPITVVSQICDNYSYKTGDTMPASYNLQACIIRERIFKRIPDNMKQDVNLRLSYLYASQTAYKVCNLISSGEIYHDWTTLENYLNNILNEVIPDEFKNDTILHVYLVRDGWCNAFAAGSGHLFINVGVFNEIQDEATLASIIAHEFSHYYLNHSLYHYIAYRRGEFDLGLLGESEKLENQFSIKDELQADSMAMRLISRSKYNIKSVMNDFEIMERHENNLISRDPELYELKENDHPKAGARYKALLDYYNKNKNDSAGYFVVSEECFNKFKTEASKQSLKCLMENLYYDDCIEKAFRLHLNYPDSIEYIQYILEAIRRLCYLEPSLWEKQFITDRYYDTINFAGKIKKRKMTDNLFAKFNYNVLPVSQAEADTIKGKFYWSGETKFKTNEQAFEFFCSLSEALGDNEYLLSNALSFADDSISMQKFLLKYLARKKIRHREYAEEIIQGKPKPFPGAKNLLLLNNFLSEIKLGHEVLPLQSFGHDTSGELTCITDTLAAKIGGRNTLYMPSLKRYHMKYYLKLLELERFTYRDIWTVNRRINIFILNPQHWELFRKLFTNEIEFINCVYFESRGGKKSLSGYAELLDESFKNILSLSKTQRYFRSCITSARNTATGAPSIKYCTYTEKLPFNSTGYDAVLSFLTEQLKEKDYQSKFIDYRYKKK